jgi:hypothetical protein
MNSFDVRLIKIIKKAASKLSLNLFVERLREGLLNKEVAHFIDYFLLFLLPLGHAC